MQDSLGDRMKDYENVTRHSLIRRMPAIIRIDGKAFHTFTRHMARPFDLDFVRLMQSTAIRLCDEIQGAQIAYVQSDEISILLNDYKSLDTQSWMNAGIQKTCSISASIATAYFNALYFDCYGHGSKAFFDSRVFNLPKEEVVNYFIWRQKDATRNSIQSVGQANFSQKQLHGLSCDAIQEKLFQEKQINWNDFAIELKRGSCIIKEEYAGENNSIRHHWVVDHNVPIFTQDRTYIQKLVD